MLRIVNDTSLLRHAFFFICEMSVTEKEGEHVCMSILLPIKKIQSCKTMYQPYELSIEDRFNRSYNCWL